MYQSPLPTHGYLRVIGAFWLYLALAVAVTAGLGVLGLPDEWTVYAFLLVALGLLIPFTPVFRRSLPAPSESE